jgi:hypothetical protein
MNNIEREVRIVACNALASGVRIRGSEDEMWQKLKAVPNGGMAKEIFDSRIPTRDLVLHTKNHYRKEKVICFF